ncbi:CAP-Gly domain containing protein [Nitzschia inconspicua]|uniref:CAP-Gly domain containing protein n=1 Tax=Nitzschia inconspicua TaxID=303405 RepID=A0A9K3LBX2_9STRA|nr:CAP-Gly domain containing protein [Nitzschia inconspicua]
MSFEVNDPVFVQNRENRQLEGVVAYIGSVDFADGDDWVGVRLTGSSVGLGKNDGTVQGRKYFDSPPQCGLFVKVSAIEKRQLNRLEMLRLRRELASSGTADTPSGGGNAVATGSTAGGSRTPIRRPATSNTDASSVTTPSTLTSSKNQTTPLSATATTTAAKSAGSSKTPSAATRLEEIRQRRAQLQGGSGSVGIAGSVPSTSAASTTTTDSQEMVSALQEQVDSLNAQLTSKTQELQSLQNEVSKTKEIAEKKDRTIKILQQDLEQAKTSIKMKASERSQEEEEHQIAKLQAQVNQLEKRLSDEQRAFKESTNELQTKCQQAEVALAAAQAQVDGLNNELASRDAQEEQEQQQSSQQRSNDASHYKERAKLQAEVASLNRRVEQLELDKQELENTVEELALDKEQLEEIKENLEDRLEELKLDQETAQMELEETKMELEDMRTKLEAMEEASTRTTTAAAVASAGAVITSVASSSGGDNNTEEQQAQEDLAQNLSIQNARLREALIRLREQSSMEKMELSRQMRTLEKQAEEAKTLSVEVESLRESRKDYEEQISDLKDMVEQGSAYEIMVEDLSDRVLSLEEELNAALQTIREMEEAADITAEMEEVQSEELKALNREMEDRETVIRNLEEAIKMQRKREEDFQRTVANYRGMLENLRQEKKALLELQEGGEGEKSDLVSASQKALARAAQLVQDAAEMRKREAQAAIDRIDSQVRMHLCERLESMLPTSVTAAEVASIKGELLLSKVVGKSSLSLDGIARSFTKTIRARAWEWRSDSGKNSTDALSEGTRIPLSQEQQQMAATMIHQSEVAHVAIDVSGDLLWLLSAGQWPDLLSSEASAELGAIMGHSMSGLDLVLGNVLNTLKEEGVLSPHQSNIGEFRQTVVATMQTLRSHIEHDGESLVPMNWKPPALKLFRDASRAKYSSLGCYAAVACILNSGESAKVGESKSQELIWLLKPLLEKLDQATSEAAKSCLRLSHLDVLDETIVAGLSEAADIWRTSADDLLGNVYNMLLSEDGLTPESVTACKIATDEVVKTVSHFATVLRSANLTDANDGSYHPFSPEVADVWEGVTLLAKAIRGKDGDAEDINYLVRARTIEHSLEDAVEAVPSLALANSRVASLEKSLSLRSKEIALQNARLSELEKLLAKTSAQPSSRLVSSQAVSSEEFNTLKKENRVLEEAMDVMHRQVEEYENEIRLLRDAKTPSKGTRSRAPRAFTPESSLRDRNRSSESLAGMEEEGHLGAFEAALFRPALFAARKDAAQWKAKATIDTLLSLPPLDVPLGRSAEEEKISEEPSPLLELSSALSYYQHETASVKLVDITKPNPRMQLYAMRMRKAAASERLDRATADARHWLESQGKMTRPVEAAEKSLLGRVKIGGQGQVRTVSAPTNTEDLYRLHLHVVQ